MRATLVIGLAGLVIVGLTPQPPAQAQKLKDIIGGIIYPRDAREYEDRAHREGRPDEEHYWHNYGEGLQRQNYYQNARQREEDARRGGRGDEERYWHEYQEGLRGQGYR